MALRCAGFLDRWHWLWLILVAPLLLFPSPARTPALLVVPLIWLAGWVVRPWAPLASTPINAPVLVMAAMVLVSVVVTADLAFSLPKVAGMVLGFGAFFSVARVARHPRGLWITLALFLLCGMGVAGLGLVGTNWIDKYGPLSAVTTRIGTQLTGLSGAEEGFQPNQVAGTLLWIIPLFVCLLVRPGIGVGKLLLAMACAITVGVFILMQSRGSYVSLAVALAVCAWLVLARRPRWVVLFVVLIASVAGGLVVWRVGVPESVQQLLLPSAFTDSSTNALNSLAGRAEIWSRGLLGVEDFPLTGMGMNMFRRLVHLMYPMFLIGPNFDVAHAHNEYLQAALDLGIPGLVAFGALYLAALWMLRRIWRAAGDQGRQGAFDRPTIRALVLGLGGGLLGHAVYGLFDAVALGAKPGVLFWWLLGLICGLYGMRGQEVRGRG
jgi:putative inorganic carbon (HCO3(-)) transporter